MAASKIVYSEFLGPGLHKILTCTFFFIDLIAEKLLGIILGQACYLKYGMS